MRRWVLPRVSRIDCETPAEVAHFERQRLVGAKGDWGATQKNLKK
jgi:hypothetical protein